MVEIRDYERVDDLQVNGLKIIQNPNGFCFGIDAVILSNFTKVKKRSKIVEFGTGTGIISILLAGKYKASHIKAFEVQEDVAEMANRSVLLNDLDDRIEIIADNLNNVCEYVKRDSVDVVVTNPPYFAPKGGIKNPEDKKAVSRHEVLCTLEDIIEKGAYCLKGGGAFYMVHRPHRLVDIIALMRKYRIEPKELRLVQPYFDKKPNILLIKGVKYGNPELKFLDPLIVYEKDGNYTKEIYEIYGMESIDVFGK